MNKRITRRRFGQIALATTTAAGLSYLSSKVYANTPKNLVIYGVRTGSIHTTASVIGTVSNTTHGREPRQNIITTATAPAITTSIDLMIDSLDLGTGQVQTQTQAGVLQTNEALSGFTTLADGTLVVAITPIRGSENAADPTRLVTLGSSPKSVNVLGLSKQEKLGSLEGTRDGGILGLVVRKNGTPPVRLVNINPQTGETTDTGILLPTDQLFTTLAQCPDQTVYTVSVAKTDGTNNLVKLDLARKQLIFGEKLELQGGVLNNGLADLICSGTGQLIAFGAPRYQTPNNLHKVEPTTGVTSLLQPFNAIRVAISRR